MPQRRPANWDRTKLVRDRVEDSMDYSPPDEKAPHGYFAERPIIGSGMDSIIGGVYPGRSPREVIVVDDTGEKEGDMELARIYKEDFLPGLLEYAKKRRARPKDAAHPYILSYIKENMPYDSERTKAIITGLTGNLPDKKIHLASFIVNKGGICRHQALFAGYLLEKLKNETDPETRLNGKISLERNDVKDEDKSGAHAWVRYTTSSGDIWILDAAQNRFGRLQDIMEDKSAWEYARPEDIQKFHKAAA